MMAILWWRSRITHTMPSKVSVSMYKVQARARHLLKMQTRTKNNSIFFYPIAILPIVPGFIDPGCIQHPTSNILSLQKEGQDEVKTPNYTGCPKNNSDLWKIVTEGHWVELE